MKVWFDIEMEYVSDTPLVMFVQYIWGTIQAHRVLGDFLQT